MLTFIKDESGATTIEYGVVEKNSAGSHDDLKNQNQLVANNNAHFDSVRLAA